MNRQPFFLAVNMRRYTLENAKWCGTLGLDSSRVEWHRRTVGKEFIDIMISGGGERRSRQGIARDICGRSASVHLDERDAAQYLNTSVRNLTELMRRRKVTYIKLGHRTVRFRVEDLDRDLDRLRVKAVGS